MKTLLVLEEVAIFVACIVAFAATEWAWWWFPALLLVPDVGMLGYLAGPRFGAATYNLVHHRAVAIGVGVFGLWLAVPVVQLAGLIMIAHISMDRALGFGLKYPDDFGHTHLANR
jgi:hypothetical protein